MKKYLILCLFVCSQLLACAKAGVNEDKSEDESESTEILKETDLIKLPLKDIVAHIKNHNFYIGVANQGKEINELSGRIAEREFDYMTPMNDFKQRSIHSTFSSWYWDMANTWINYATSKRITLRIHGPISPQCSNWVMEDNRTAAELSRMLEEYMTNLCEHYGKCSCVRWMDVVNETISRQVIKDPIFGIVNIGDWFGPRQGTDQWENPWTIIGFDEKSEMRVPLYIDKAFEISNKYAPNVKQIINQHGDFEEVVWEKMKKLVSYLRDVKGRRVDGLGWQAHINVGWEKIPGNLERLDNFITWCHNHKLDFHVTEMNVWIRDKNLATEVEQAETYAAILDVLLKHTDNGVVGLNFWGVRDIDVPNKDWMGCLWRDDGTSRPAYDRIKQELIKYILK